MAVDAAAPLGLLNPSDASSEPTLVGSGAASGTSTALEPLVPIAATAPDTDRSFDGSGNNLANPKWGSTSERLLRIAPAEYGDGISTIGGAGRPSPRVISNALAAQQQVPSSARGLSALVYIWGQFLDHDIDHTGTNAAVAERVPIAVPTGDIFFDPNGTGTQTIPLTRSIFDPATGTGLSNPRQQVNQITAWIDASMIYGSDQATADALRTFLGGELRSSAGNLLPEKDGEFFAGDVRANENIELTSMQTLFLREHNRLARQMATTNPTWTDERIYQEARALVYAKIQVITYKEFLPALLGDGALGPYQGYNPSVHPGIANEFSTAAYRLHTMVNDEVEFFGNDGRPVRAGIPLVEAFHNPGLLKATGIDSILKYAASTQAQEIDNQIVDGLRNFLFGPPGLGGLDLASLNIQRGRDHGLADYNAVRRAYGLAAVTAFSDITSNGQLALALQQLYGSVDNIDLWVGIMAEDHVPGASMGELGRTIIADQFERLRDGDRFWYQSIFSGAALDYLERTTLAGILRRNTTINNLQDNVFFMQADVTGQVFADLDGNGSPDGNQNWLAGITVELWNDAGQVVARTRTDGNGFYRFRIAETGEYQVRVLVPNRTFATPAPQTVLISRGDVDISGIGFGLRRATFRRRVSFAAVDAAFESAGMGSALFFFRQDRIASTRLADGWH